jgi:hypothetical protein
MKIIMELIEVCFQKPVERRLRKTRTAAAARWNVERHLAALADHRPHDTLATKIAFHKTEELVETAD